MGEQGGCSHDTHAVVVEDGLPKQAIEDSKVFGCFPEFVEFLDPNEAYEISRKLSSIGKRDVENILNRIHQSWEMIKTTQSAFCSFIIQRAAFVATHLTGKLFQDNLNFSFE